MCVGYCGGTRSRLTVVGGMASGSPWTGVNVICHALVYCFWMVQRETPDATASDIINRGVEGFRIQ